MSVINDPPAPVLAVRYGTKKRDQLKRIVVPVHLKQKSHGALDLALQIAQRRNAELHLVTLCESTDRDAAQKMLDDAVRANSGVSMKTEILRGSDVEREIVRYSDKVEADAIFLNADQQIGRAKIEIVRHAATPVMVVPGSK